MENKLNLTSAELYVLTAHLGDNPYSNAEWFVAARYTLGEKVREARAKQQAQQDRERDIDFQNGAPMA